MRSCKVIELGLIPYAEAFALQRQLVAARKADVAPDALLLCQHPHVITMGRNGNSKNLIALDHTLVEMGVELCESDRGGDITYHGPGQLVGYPILNLGEIRRDVAWYVHQLEETMIEVSNSFGVGTSRVPGRRGVWTGSAPGANAVQQREEKLGAIGVHLSRWVTSHGFAYNVSTDLRYFDLIVPCGIQDSRATSLEKVLGFPVSAAEVTERIVSAFGNAFAMEMICASREDMRAWLAQNEIRNEIHTVTASA